MSVLSSVMLFAAAGLLEIGGGYLMWLWLREGRPAWLGALSVLVLAVYAVVPTMQRRSVPFGRVYAAYGGLFIIFSMLWGWRVDGIRPDRVDVMGAIACGLGAAIIMFTPRVN